MGLRLVQECCFTLKDEIREDPLRPVAQVYEQEVTNIQETLDGADRNEFIAMMPNLKSMERCLYR